MSIEEKVVGESITQESTFWQEEIWHLRFRHKEGEKASVPGRGGFFSRKGRDRDRVEELTGYHGWKTRQETTPGERRRQAKGKALPLTARRGKRPGAGGGCSGEK